MNVISKLFAGSKPARDVNSLHDAVRLGDGKLIKTILKDNPGLISSIGASGKAALHLAVIAGNKDVVALLLAHKAEINAKDYEGLSPLHIVVRNGNAEMVEFLLSKLADVNAANEVDYVAGTTPLHLAAKKGHKRIAETLVAYGANMNAEDVVGLTPLSYALIAKNKDLESLIRSHGGSSKPFAFEVPKPSTRICQACNGSGRQLSGGGGYQACRWCHGRGRSG